MYQMTNKQKKQLYRIVAAAAVFGAAFFLPQPLRIAAFGAAYLAVGSAIVIKAARNMAHGDIFDENFLMTAATFGAIALGEYAEAVGVMLFYQVGEFFQSCAVNKSRRSIADAMDIRPDYANLLRDGDTVTVDPSEIRAGDMIVIRPGERTPTDGVVTEGHSSLDTSALTGESAPRDVAPGDEIMSGCINHGGLLTVRVTRPYEESTVSKILNLVENASSRKSRSENFITRFARYYTPAVVLAAAALAIVPPLVTGQPFGIWVSRALTFLVISCPCALVISVPLSFFGGIGGASSKGILVKGSNYLEALSEARIAVFDKTGTLTSGKFSVSDIRPSRMGKDELLETAAYAESASTHPLAASIGAAWGGTIDRGRIGEIRELPGRGVRAVVDGAEVLAGNARLMEESGVGAEAVSGTVVHICRGGIYAGCIVMEDTLKSDAKRAVERLKSCGTDVVMLTGDSKEAAHRAAQLAGIDRFYAQLLPGDKVARVEELMAELGGSGKLVFVGDGINDAPVLARSDIGIAMGGLGSDAAIEAADVVIMTDEPSKVADAIRISRGTMAIVRQNVVFAIGIKILFLGLGAAGYTSMWGAVFADVGVSVIAILNAMRTLRG